MLKNWTKITWNGASAIGGYPSMEGAIAALDPFQPLWYWPLSYAGAMVWRNDNAVHPIAFHMDVDRAIARLDRGPTYPWLVGKTRIFQMDVVL